VARLEHLAEVLASLKVEDGVAIEKRTYVGPAEATARLRELEDIAAGLAQRDILSLYDKTIAHDGVFPEDIYQSGRYYAYLRFELKGMTPEEKEENLVRALDDIVQKHGKDAVLKYVPPVIKGRQVTENLMVRPEVEDFPSYYSKMRMAYAERMAVDEVPRVALAAIRDEQESVLSQYSWTTVRIVDADGIPTELCGNMYLAAEKTRKLILPYERLWALIMERGPESFYDVSIANDGEYPIDEMNPNGRYFAYVKAELKGLNSEERRKNLLAAIPQEIVGAIGQSEIVDIFPEKMNGDPVTIELTIRPENEEYPSYYNAKKVENGRKRASKQILYNIQAEIISLVENKFGAFKSVIILE
jgi:hypothetical protein